MLKTETVISVRRGRAERTTSAAPWARLLAWWLSSGGGAFVSTPAWSGWKLAAEDKPERRTNRKRVERKSRVVLQLLYILFIALVCVGNTSICARQDTLLLLHGLVLRRWAGCLQPELLPYQQYVPVRYFVLISNKSGTKKMVLGTETFVQYTSYASYPSCTSYTSYTSYALYTLVRTHG